MPSLSDFQVRFNPKTGTVDLRPPFDDSRYRDTIVRRELSDGVTVYEYEDGKFYSIEIGPYPHAGLNVEAWGMPRKIET